MEERLKRVERQFIEWVEDVRLAEDVWFPDLEHMVLRFLVEKQKKYRKIETLNRMLRGPRNEVKAEEGSKDEDNDVIHSKVGDANNKVDNKKMFRDKQVPTSKRVTFSFSK